jgi:DUF1365 family protein
MVTATSRTALYDVRVEHVRSEPIRNVFGYGGYQWLVDLDALPSLPPGLRALARFEARDHLGDPTRSIRDNVVGFLATQQIFVGTGRIRMLTQARVLGYVFNPLSVYWCHDDTGALVCVVAEVHNTYGERHAYVLHTDERGRAETEKAFYVSPFYPVEGAYRMSLPEPGEALDLTITLHREGARPFVASVRGRRVRASTLAILRTLLRHPIAPLVGAIRIRRQGIGLWIRGLRPEPRPDHHQEGVS